MKKVLLCSALGLSALALSATRADAQYNITTHSFYTPPDSTCSDPILHVETNAYTAGLSMLTYFGDGTTSTLPVLAGGSVGYVDIMHTYSSPGTYTVKHVLLNGTSRVDSTVYSKEYLYCQSFGVRCYNDLNSNCVFDSGVEDLIQLPMTIEVKKGGVPIDTFSCLSGYYYSAMGVPGDVFTFRVLSTPSGITITCPSTPSVNFTVAPIVNAYSVQYFGAQCTGSSGFDLGVYGSARTGRHSYITDVVVNNAFCSPASGTLVMHASPKYGSFVSATPTPTSVVGHTLTWNLTGLSLINPKNINVHFEQSPWLTPGDTVHTDFVLTPTTGDSDPTNNSLVMVDTVSGSFDPNDKAVKPTGYISSGTKLTYTLRFENTGNDTAFNIHILDTLSANLDIRTLEMIASSHKMNLGWQSYGAQTIARFDFPDINLLDSTHHGLCDGFVMFSIKTKPGLVNGTVIPNRGGIYFDYNAVVMTNTVQNIIGIPTDVSEMSNVAPAITVYPNPVNDELYVDLTTGRFHTISIANMMGQQLMSQAVNNAQEKVSVKQLPAGVYLLQLKGEHGTEVRKFEKL